MTINITPAWLIKEATQEAREKIIADCAVTVNKAIAGASTRGLFRVVVNIPDTIDKEVVADLFRHNGYTVMSVPPSPDGLRLMFQWETAEAPHEPPPEDGEDDPIQE